jgi:hypothetical protein
MSDAEARLSQQEEKDKRTTTDRRKTPTKPFSRYTISGKRRKARRQDEDKNYYVDWYETRDFIFILSIVLLCILDAFFTLKIITNGGIEVNPLMVNFIARSPAACLAFKYIVTVVCMIVILMHKNFLIFGLIKAYAAIYLIFGIYLILIIYEAYFYFSHG